MKILERQYRSRSVFEHVKKEVWPRCAHIAYIPFCIDLVDVDTSILWMFENRVAAVSHDLCSLRFTHCAPSQLDLGALAFVFALEIARELFGVLSYRC